MATTEAEKWLERIEKLCAPIWNNGEEPEEQLELVDIVVSGLVLHLGRDRRITISRFPDGGSDPDRGYPGEEETTDDKAPRPGIDDHGDDPYLPFLFLEWGGPESLPLPGMRMH